MQREIQRTVRELFKLKDFSDPMGVTLTMKQRTEGVWLDRIIASRNLRHFLNRLNKSVLGNAFHRYGKTIGVIPVMEKSKEGRLHYHLVVDNPYPTKQFEFEWAIKKCWLKTKWGYEEVHVHRIIDEGWIEYITKFATKNDLADAIDWINYYQPDC